MADLDRRTKAAQVALETKQAIMADLGGEERLSTLEKIMVENAAMSAAVLRDAHVRWMQGQAVPVSELATLENTFKPNRINAWTLAESQGRARHQHLPGGEGGE